MSNIFLDRYGREIHLEDNFPVEKKGFFAVMVKDNKVLVTYPMSVEIPEFPGGSMKRKETVQECLYRKLYEETGIEFMLGKSGVEYHHVVNYFAEEEKPCGVFYIYNQTFFVYDAEKFGLDVGLERWRAPDGSKAEWIDIEGISEGRVKINHLHCLAFKKLFEKS